MDIGMIVAILLIVPMVLIFIYGVILQKKQDKEAELAKSVPDEKILQTAVVEEAAIEEIETYTENEEELIAVITAAISAITQKPASGFRVTSFKKRSGWKSGN